MSLENLALCPPGHGHDLCPYLHGRDLPDLDPCDCSSARRPQVHIDRYAPAPLLSAVGYKKTFDPRSERFLDPGFSIGCGDGRRAVYTMILENICSRSRIVCVDRRRRLDLCDVWSCCDGRGIRRRRCDCWCRVRRLLLRVWVVIGNCRLREDRIVSRGGVRRPRWSGIDGDEGVMSSEIVHDGRARRDMGCGCLSVRIKEEPGEAVGGAMVVVVLGSLDALGCC